MSDSQKIFNEITILKAFTIWINDTELFPEDVLSLEIKWSFDQFYVSGSLIIKDSFGLSDLGMFNGTTEIKIYAKDFYDEPFDRKFTVINVSQQDYNERFKAYTLSFVDRIYFKMVNAYISTGFNDIPSNALDKFFTQLDIDTIIEDEKLSKDFGTDGEPEPFCVPQDRSSYEFFTQQMRRVGYRWWQDRNTIHAKKIDINQMPVATAKEPIVYSNNTDNDKYGFKIHDFDITYNNILNMNMAYPISSNMKFDPTSRSMNSTTLNLDDVYPTMKLNDMAVDPSELTLIHTTGQKVTTQEIMSTDQQKLEIEDVYMENSILNIVVPGNFKYNFPGQIVEVEFKGNPMIQKSSLEGDTFHSGKYFLKDVSDRYFGDKLIQKLKLVRADFMKPRTK